MKKRRKLVIALGASALIAPFASFAQQQGKVWRIGFLAARSRSTASNPDAGYDAFMQGMRELGYVEGKNLVIEWRFGDSKFERLPALAAELIRMKVELIVTHSTSATEVLQRATGTIPIVTLGVSDPVSSGFAKSLAHPGGNITGISNLSGDISPKYLEMLRSMVPKLFHVAVLMNPENSFHATVLKNVQTAAQKSRIKILPVEARTAPEIEKAFSAMAREKAGAVIVARETLFTQQVRQIADLAMKHRLPSITAVREYAEAGGLMSYGPNNADLYGRAATYVDKILKGAKPGDLPVEQPTTFELLINGKTAKALGLTIPQELLLRADKVIE